MNLFVRTAIAAVLAPAAAVGALWGADLVLGDEGAGEGMREVASAQEPAPEPVEAPSRYDLFSPADGHNPAAAVSAACGFSTSLTGGGTRIVMAGDPVDQVFIEQAEDGEAGEDGRFTRFTARAGAVHAFAHNGELFVQAGHEDRDGLDGRVWLLDAEGAPTFSGPLAARGRMALTCDDAEAAAAAFNAALAPAGGPAAPVRAAVRAFEIGDGFDAPRDGSGDAFISACTPPVVLADLPGDAPFVLTAEYDADARYGEAVVHEMSEESLEGVAEPMIHVTLADLGAAPDYAGVRRLSLPVSWSDLAPGDGTVAVIYRFKAVEAREWMIEPDGARAHSMGAGVFADVSLPCADAEAGVAALRAMRDGVTPGNGPG